MVYRKAVLELVEAMGALRAMLLAAPSLTRSPVAIAIVEEHGDLLAYAKMDGTPPLARELAIKKAHTSAKLRLDLCNWHPTAQSDLGWRNAYGDPELVSDSGGGVAIQRAGTGATVGAIGVSGGTPEEDEAVARVGLATMQR